MEAGSLEAGRRIVWWVCKSIDRVSRVLGSRESVDDYSMIRFESVESTTLSVELSSNYFLFDVSCQLTSTHAPTYRSS
jgi:hypothetical protein